MLKVIPQTSRRILCEPFRVGAVAQKLTGNYNSNHLYSRAPSGKAHRRN